MVIVIAKKFIIHYIPNTTFAFNAVFQLEVKNSVRTYAQVSPDKTIVVKTKYTALPQEIIVPESIDITYGKTIRIPIHISDVTNEKGLKINVESKMKEIAELVESTVELDLKGEAFVSVKGNLPGQTSLILTIDGTDVKKEINVNVLSVDTDAPNQKPTISASDITINVGEKPNWMEGVTASDLEDGNLTSKVEITQNNVNIAKAGIYKIVYSVSDNKGLTATKEIKVTVVAVKDVTPPSVPTVNPVYDNATVISGKAETNAKVYAMVGSKKVGVGTSKKGVYTIKITKQKTGTTIAVYAVDLAGNKSAKKTVKVIDKTPPSVPTVNKITNKSVTVTGKGEKGATIYIYNGSKKIGQGKVDSKGKYKVKIKAQKKGSKIKVQAKDKAGNKSKSKTVKVS